MKKSILQILACIVLAGCSAPMQTVVTVRQDDTSPAVNQDENSYQVFYDQLGAYGNWIDYPSYGYVWQPNVDASFRPYATNGHWVYSDSGWTWVSGYPWGWAAFHYGRWFYEDGYGWLWVPGHQWAPAWVTWGQSGEYYGWAPLAPNVDPNDHSWAPPENAWNFVPAQHVTKTDVANYTVVHENNTTVIDNIVKNVNVINNIKTVNNTYVTNNSVTNNTATNNNVTNNTTNNSNVTNNNTTNNSVTNNTTTNNHVVNTTTVYNPGPEVSKVESAANVKVQKVNIQGNNKPGSAVVSNNNVVMYRPVIKPATEQPKDNNKPKPKQVKTYEPRPAVKP